MWIFVTLLAIAAPVFFGTSVIYAIDSFLPHDRHRIVNKTLTLTVESVVLVTPCCIHCLFAFVTPSACMWIAVGTIVVFVFALFLRYGNDVESCVVVLIIAILVPEIVISVEWMMDAYKKTHQDEVTTGALNTDKSMNHIGGMDPDHSEVRPTPCGIRFGTGHSCVAASDCQTMNILTNLSRERYVIRRASRPG